MKYIINISAIIIVLLLFSCTNKKKDDSLTKHSTHKVTIMNITTDVNKSTYRTYRYDPNKPIMKTPIIMSSNNHVEAFGKKFKSDKEFKEYEKKLENNSNNSIFSALKELDQTPDNVPLAIVESEDMLKYEKMNNSAQFPTIIIDILNNENKTIKLESIIVTAFKGIPCACEMDCRNIIPDERYVVYLSKKFIFPDIITIKPNNIKSVRFKILPLNFKQKRECYGSDLLCNIKLNWGNGYLISKYFILSNYD